MGTDGLGSYRPFPVGPYSAFALGYNYKTELHTTWGLYTEDKDSQGSEARVYISSLFIFILY